MGEGTHSKETMDTTIAHRLASLDWPAIRDSLEQHGYALTPALLTPSECAALVSLYPSEEPFRSHIIMSRYRFGRGDYKYFRLPSARHRPAVARA